MNTCTPIQKPFIWSRFLLVALSAIFLLSSCATRVNFATSTVVPAAEGKVKVKKDKNNNYAISIDVENLAEPGRLPMPQNYYIAWAEMDNNTIQNLGQLRTGAGLLSSKLKASMQTVSPTKPRRIFITGESAVAATYPGTYVVLNTTSF
ncbi:MAG TPA: hypothetical protein VEX65_02315 [Flavisolibacter sp.]|nr:hypothetical protein [Flavisolibacter sp.]